MKKLAFLFNAALLGGGLLGACQPRNLIPSAASASSTAATLCDKIPNCGQCVSDARCGWCAANSRCLATERASTCASNWIPKDPEQQLCPADTPNNQSQTAK